MQSRGVVLVILCTMLVFPSLGMLVQSHSTQSATQLSSSGPAAFQAPDPGTMGDPGSGWIPDVHASWLSGAIVNRNASVGADRNGTVHTAYEASSGRYGICVAGSQDGGMSWNENSCTYINSEDYRHPSIGVNCTGGEALIAFEGSSGGLRLGYEFPHMSGSTVILTTNPGDQNPSITISRDTSANAFLAFERGDGSGGVDVMFMAARDQGIWRSWELPQILVGEYDHTINSKPRIAWGPPNNVYVAYERQSTSGDRDVFIMRSSNGGMRGSWILEPGIPVSATISDESAPDIAAILGSGTVVVPFARAEGVYKQIYAAYSDDWGNDSSWKTTPVTSEPLNHENPRVASVPVVDAVRIAYWTWWGIFESIAPISSLSSWRMPVRVSDGAARLTSEYNTPSIAAYPYGGKWYTGVVWTDNRNGGQNYDIYYSTNSPKLYFPSPDLIPTSIDILPNPPLLNNTVAHVNVTIANPANVSAGEFDLLLFDDMDGDMMPDQGENLSTSHSIGMASFSHTHILQDWNAAPVGVHSLCAYADPPPGHVTETDETNNVICADVVVKPAPVLRPDYVPDSPTPPSLVVIGISLQVSLSIQVSNQGNGTAKDNALVAFHEQSSPPFSTFVLSPLAPATTSSRFTATWPSPAVPGTYLVSVDVDFENNVTEWDETNNAYTWTIEVVSGPVTALVIGYPNYTSPAIATYVKSSTPLSLSVLDQSGLGIRNTTYTVDGGNTANYSASGTFFLAGEGLHTIEWQSLDWAGNLELVDSMNLTVDDTPPATTIHQSDMQATTATVFTLTATDAGCSVNITKYRFDGGSWITYSGGFTLPEGEHNISYYSNDMLNNTERERWLVVTVEGTTTPLEVVVNFKPILALVFAIVLLVAGVWSSKRRPWKGGKDRVAKALAITSMPFVVAEGGTGIVSLFTGQLSIPPLIGVGTAVDLSILMAGISVAILRALKPETPGPEGGEGSGSR